MTRCEELRQFARSEARRVGDAALARDERILASSQTLQRSHEELGAAVKQWACGMRDNREVLTLAANAIEALNNSIDILSEQRHDDLLKIITLERQVDRLERHSHDSKA